jgi:hypothetical protein
MKKEILTFGVLLTVSALSAQITISKYPVEFKCAVDATDQLEFPEATSTCGEVSRSYDEQIFSGGCLGNVVRTITYTDACGNRAQAQQFITLTDNLEPELIGVPSNVTLNKGEEIPKVPIVDSRDNSGQLFPVEFAQTQKDNVITRIWTCTDACGNVAEARQTITLE